LDSFEAVVAQILEQQGYWVRRAFKVELTKEEKREIHRPSSPRWEIDIVAYRARGNAVLAVECKSYLDSPGVGASAFAEQLPGSKSSYKLFVETRLREVVLKRLVLQMYQAGLCERAPTVRLALAAGHVSREADRDELRHLFAEKGWDFFDEEWLEIELRKMAAAGYEDLVPSVVAKLILRRPLEARGE